MLKDQLTHQRKMYPLAGRHRGYMPFCLPRSHMCLAMSHGLQTGMWGILEVSSMRETAIDFLVGICIQFAILFGFGAMTMAFDIFYPREQHAYRAASEPPEPIIGRMSYGAGLKRASDASSRAHRRTIAVGS
jgi:hypothetical protein